MDAAFGGGKGVVRVHRNRLMFMCALFSGGRKREVIYSRMCDIKPVTLRSESGREFGMCQIIIHGIKDGCGTKERRRVLEGKINTPPYPEYYRSRVQVSIPAPLRVWTEYQLYIKELGMDLDIARGKRHLLFAGQNRPNSYEDDFYKPMSQNNPNNIIYSMAKRAGVPSWQFKALRTLFNTQTSHVIGDDLDAIIFTRHKNTKSLAPYKYRHRKAAIQERLVGAMLDSEPRFEERMDSRMDDMQNKLDSALAYIHQTRPLVQQALVQNQHPQPTRHDLKLTDYTT